MQIVSDSQLTGIWFSMSLKMSVLTLILLISTIVVLLLECWQFTINIGFHFEMFEENEEKWPDIAWSINLGGKYGEKLYNVSLTAVGGVCAHRFHIRIRDIKLAVETIRMVKHTIQKSMDWFQDWASLLKNCKYVYKPYHYIFQSDEMMAENELSVKL